MKSVLEAQITKQTPVKRIIGKFRGSRPGPTVVAIGGMHGNEPSGVMALKQVVKQLEKEQPDFAGEFIALAGNLRALSLGKRYIDRDLNRMWHLGEDQTSLEKAPPIYERSEMQALQRIIEDAIDKRRGPFICLDLHTTSAESPPFILIGDTLRNRSFVKDLELPVILGLEEQLNGPLLSYLNTRGHITMGFEAGRHDAPGSVDNHISLIWLILMQAGCIRDKKGHAKEIHLKWLSSQTDRELKNFFEVRFRYAVRPEEQFRMRPGYTNFQPIEPREPLADNLQGAIGSNQGGRIFMPLYQEQGEDGFFIIRRIPAFWLKVSVALRKLRAHKLLPLLPGIRRHRLHPGSLIVNVRIVRWFGPQLLHLLGYRRRSRLGNKLHFIKRRHDLKGPSPLDRLPR